MKKVLFIISFLSFLFLSFTTLRKDHNPQGYIMKKFGTCAAPNSLSASKNGLYVTLGRLGSSSCYTYGGYYNYYDMMHVSHISTFSGSACTNPGVAYVSVDATAYSMTFQVTAVCGDGTSTTSAPHSGPL